MSLEQLHIIDPSENLIPTPINENSNKIMSWATSVTNEIDDLKNFRNIKETNVKEGTFPKFYLYRMGHIVYMTTLNVNIFRASGSQTIGHIPNGYKPTQTIAGTAHPIVVAWSISGVYYTNVYENGNISLATNFSGDMEYSETLIWYTNDPMPTE